MKYSYTPIQFNKKEDRKDLDEDSYATEIIENLWLGNSKSASNISFFTEKKIKKVINATQTVQNYFESKSNFIEYMRISIKNKKTYREYLKNNLSKIYTFIDEALSNNQSVLIHCTKGRVQSAIIVAYYLMKKYSRTKEDTINYIKSRRDTVLSKKSPLEVCLDF